MKDEKWYDSRLNIYFEKNYGEYSDTAGWFTNPAPNQWLFVILELGLKITLTCDDKGNVTESEEKIG